MKIPSFAKTLAYATGKTIYCRIFVHNTEWAWDENTRTIFYDPSYSDTCIPCPESSLKHIYKLAAPALLPTGDYDLLFFEQVGGSPAETDTLVAAMRYAHSKRD